MKQLSALFLGLALVLSSTGWTDEKTKEELHDEVERVSATLQKYLFSVSDWFDENKWEERRDKADMDDHQWRTKQLRSVAYANILAWHWLHLADQLKTRFSETVKPTQGVLIGFNLARHHIWSSFNGEGWQWYVQGEHPPAVYKVVRQWAEANNKLGEYANKISGGKITFPKTYNVTEGGSGDGGYYEERSIHIRLEQSSIRRPGHRR